MRISGVVYSKTTGQGAGGLVVVLSEDGDSGRGPIIALASDVTDENGRFVIDVEESIGKSATVKVFAEASDTEPLATAPAPAQGGQIKLTVSLKVGDERARLIADGLTFRPLPITNAADLQKRIKLQRKSLNTAIRLLAKPKRPDPLFIPPGDDGVEKQNGVIADGLERMRKLSPSISPGALDASEIASLGIPNPSIGDLRDLIGTIPSRVPDDDCDTRTGLVDIVRNDQLLSVSASQNGSSDDAAGEDTLTDEGGGETDTDDERDPLGIKARIEKILDGLDRDLGERPNTRTIREDLTTQIAGGPADATAYHDFHSLHFAWKDVWTSVVDRESAEALKWAYYEAVKFQGTAGGAEDDDFSEFDDIEEAAEAVRAAVSAQSNRRRRPRWRGRRNADDDDETPSRLEQMLEDVQEALRRGYKFDVFRPGSHNFGILVNYRQRWQPISYQVGQLVGTIPLAPGQKQTVVSREVLKQSRSTTEARRSLASRSFESSSTTRADAEIVNKAVNSSNFAMSAQGSVTAGIKMIEASASRSMQFGSNQARDSAQTKRDFREAVRKAASEYRDERSVEVTTARESESFRETTTELSNPNNELTITYLFYELQRRYHVSEKLNGVTPVVMVALEVPAPHEIDEAWLLEHEWILRRVLLDDTYASVLDTVSEGLVDAEIAVKTMQAALEGQGKLVQELKMDLKERKSALAAAQAELNSQVTKSVRKKGIFQKFGEWIGGGHDDGAKKRANVEASRAALEWTEADLSELSEEMRAGASALQQSARDYVDAVSDLQMRRLSVDRLRLHVRQNILYYMQAIWAHTPPDQLYFQLYNQEIRWPEATGQLEVADRRTITEGIDADGNPIERVVVDYRFPMPDLDEHRMLHEVADVDTILGFKGNYVILPLRESNALTDLMMQPYRRNKAVFDPDRNDLLDPIKTIDKVRCAIKSGALTGQLNAARNNVSKSLKVLLNSKLDGEVITVPSGQLFIEALPGSRPLLEDFKLHHRRIDAERAQQGVIGTQLENVRWGARLVEGLRSDPDVDQRVEVDVSSSDANVNIDVP